MATNFSRERMEQRTPYTPDGFRHLHKPEASRVFDISGGRLHFFGGQDFQRQLPILREYAVQIDQPAFKIPYWIAMTEVSYNMRRDAQVSAAFFEPDESWKNRLSKLSQEKGKERVLSGALNRLTAPFIDWFNQPTVSEINFDPPFVAYCTLETWKIPTNLGILTGAYFSTMAAEPGFVGGGVIGPSLFQYGYNLVDPDLVLFRVQNGAPVSALEKANVTEGPVFGVDEEPNSIMRNCAQFFEERTLHPQGIDMDKLIARGVYSEGENRTYAHGQTRGRAFEVTERLRARGVDPKNGDGAYVAVWGKGKKELREKSGQGVFVFTHSTKSESDIN